MKSSICSKAATFFFVSFVALSVYVQDVECLYGPDSPVKVLNAQQFKDKVLGSEGYFIVEFFAPWCGHCKSFAPEYEKAAKALKGVVRVVAVEDQTVMQDFGVQGFPTIKALISTGKGQPKTVDYSGARSAAALVDFAFTHLKSFVKSRLPGGGGGAAKDESGAGPSDVVVLTDKNFDKLVMKDESNVWFVEFYAPWCGHCKALAPTWKELATRLKGKVKVGMLDATKESSTASRFGVKGYPTLKLFPAGTKSDSSAVPYEGGSRGVDDLANFAMRFYGDAVKAEQLLSDEQFRETCGTGLCVLAFLPHILDTTVEERKKHLDILNKVAKSSADTPAKFLWIQGGDQFELEEKMHLSFGYPAVVALRLEKEVFAVHRGTFTYDNVKSFLTRLTVSESIKNVPKLKKVEAWKAGGDKKDKKEEKQKQEKESHDEL